MKKELYKGNPECPVPLVIKPNTYNDNCIFYDIPPCQIATRHAFASLQLQINFYRKMIRDLFFNHFIRFHLKPGIN